MAFNHYARLRQIVEGLEEGWYIKLIDKPTVAKNFQGQTVRFDHYYRIYDATGQMVKYGKFQQLDRLAKALGVPSEALPVRRGG